MKFVYLWGLAIRVLILLAFPLLCYVFTFEIAINTTIDVILLIFIYLITIYSIIDTHLSGIYINLKKRKLTIVQNIFSKKQVRHLSSVASLDTKIDSNGDLKILITYKGGYTEQQTITENLYSPIFALRLSEVSRSKRIGKKLRKISEKYLPLKDE